MTTLNVTLDEEKAFDIQKYCDTQNITLQDAFYTFVQEYAKKAKKFSLIKKTKESVLRRKAISAVNSMRKKSEKNGLSNMTMEEINAEISACRADG